MKILTLIMIFAFLWTNMLAQSKEDQDKKKEKIKVQFKTKKEIEREKAEEMKIYQPNVASFESRTARISDNILTQNLNYYHSIKTNLGQSNGILLRDVDLNQMSRVEIANETNNITILHPINLYTARLSYYSAEGRLLWDRDIDFKSPGHDLSQTLLFHKISNNGKRIVVCAIQYESVNVVAVYDENGNELSNPGGYFHMSPTGNFFYRSDPFYWSSALTIYDNNLSPINLDITSFVQHEDRDYQYEYQYRIFEHDILVLRIRENSVQRNNRVKQKNKSNQKIYSDKLYFYDLQKKEVIMEEDLLINDSESYSIAFTEGRMDVKNDRFVSSILDKGRGQIELLIINLNTKSHQTLRIHNGLGLFSLSQDGASLLVSRSEKRSSLVGIRKYSVLNLATNQFIIENIQYDPKRSVKSFTLGDTSIAFLFYAPDEVKISFSQFARYSREGDLLEELSGWFNLKQTIAYLPLTNQSDNSKIDILKINMGVVK